MKIALFFQISAILKYNFPKKKTITFFRRKLSKLHKKDNIFACDNQIFPKTWAKKKQWIHLGAFNLVTTIYFLLLVKTILVSWSLIIWIGKCTLIKWFEAYRILGLSRHACNDMMWKIPLQVIFFIWHTCQTFMEYGSEKGASKRT